MSSTVFPSPPPCALSGSLLVTDSRTSAAEPHASVSVTCAWISSIRWFGGQSASGVSVTVRFGGVWSVTVTGQTLVVVSAGSLHCTATFVVPGP